MKNSWKRSQTPTKIAVVVALLVIVSGIVWFTARAAGFFSAVEPDSATLTTNAKLLTDSTASGGKAIQFTAAAPAPTPTPPPAPTGCPNALHTPGGPDGFGGCWPWEGNTGIPAGTVLSNYTGSCTVTTNNTVIDKKTVNCYPLQIQASNVTITKSQINGFVQVDGEQCAQPWSFNISDSRIHTDDITAKGLSFCNYTATRVNVTGGNSMAWCANCTIQDSYLHSPLEDPRGIAHNSTVRMAANAVIKHNTLWCVVKSYPGTGGDSSGCSANQTGYSHDGAAPYNSTVERNLYMPTTGGYCSYGGSTIGDLSSVRNIVFKDNVFKRGTDPSDKGTFVCGYYGAVTSFDGSRPGNQWLNNRWDDGTVLNP